MIFTAVGFQINACPNCYVLTAKTEEEKEFYYWITFGLWQSKSFHPYLKGSVIPFIIIGKLKKLIVQASYKAITNPDKFNKAVNTLFLTKLFGVWVFIIKFG